MTIYFKQRQEIPLGKKKQLNLLSHKIAHISAHVQSKSRESSKYTCEYMWAILCDSKLI